MRPCEYERVVDVDAALELGGRSGAAFYAGGTTLVDLMKLDVVAPATVVDINALPFAGIEELGTALRLGALVRMSDAADDPRVRTAFPAVAEALAASASGQLRNMATLGGNLLQRTRCAYFRDIATPCNKREPGSGCGALLGLNEEHAVLGTSDACIAAHPSDLAVALAAFDACVRVQGRDGVREIPIAEFFLVPEDRPERETTLRPGELIVAIDLPYTPAAARSTYLKVRDRTSFAFALVSCAAAVKLDSDGSLADVRVALGGVGTIPWRARATEDALRGKPPSAEAFASAARAAFAEARPTTQNAYKVDLGIRAIVRALDTVTA